MSSAFTTGLIVGLAIALLICFGLPAFMDWAAADMLRP